MRVGVEQPGQTTAGQRMFEQGDRLGGVGDVAAVDQPPARLRGRRCCSTTASRVREPAGCREASDFSRRAVGVGELPEDPQRAHFLNDDPLRDRRHRLVADDRSRGSNPNPGRACRCRRKDSLLQARSWSALAIATDSSPPLLDLLRLSAERSRARPGAARRASRTFRRWSSEARLQTAISSIVRKQPRQKPVSSIRQTLMHGEATSCVGS
jgi:hypothetical protein